MNPQTTPPPPALFDQGQINAAFLGGLLFALKLLWPILVLAAVFFVVRVKLERKIDKALLERRIRDEMEIRAKIASENP